MRIPCRRHRITSAAGPRRLHLGAGARSPPATYTPRQIKAGEPLFATYCGFCHGRDAMGGETGPDLTRSELVADDVRRDKIKPIVRNGRPDKGMPPLNLTDADLTPIVAFVHDARTKAGSVRRRAAQVDETTWRRADARRGRSGTSTAPASAPAATRRKGTSPVSPIASRGSNCCSACSTPAGRGGRAQPGTRHRDAAVRRERRRPAGVPRRVHDRPARHQRLVPLVVHQRREVHRRQSARRARRSDHEIHRRRHAQRAGLFADAEGGGGAAKRRGQGRAGNSRARRRPRAP